MASLLETLSENYKDWSIGANSEVDKWFLMESPGGVVSIVLFYLIFVLKVGPEIMKSRKPMELKNTLIAYNAFQVLFSIYLVAKMAYIDVPLKNMFSRECLRDIDGGKKLFLEGTWWYFLAKVTELWDTFFFILRKKMGQVSFLHIYHHSSMVFFTWLFLKYNPSAQATLIGMINSSIHIIMYFYYMISAMGPAYQKYIWWKKYITILQLVQFCVVIVYLMMTIFSECGFSRNMTCLMMLNTAFFLHLFGDFYRKSYKKTAKSNNKNDKGDDKERIVLKSSILGEENAVYPKISENVTMSNEELRKRQ